MRAGNQLDIGRGVKEIVVRPADVDVAPAKAAGPLVHTQSGQVTESGRKDIALRIQQSSHRPAPRGRRVLALAIGEVSTIRAMRGIVELRYRGSKQSQSVDGCRKTNVDR